MPAKNDLTLQLSDGRTLGYSEHGALDGTPVIFLHGNPGSRLMRHPDESIAESLGVRILTPDRPGYGLSDFKKKRTLLDMPDDIAQLADMLGIDKFAVFGVSAGAPYVAALAYAMPERITSAAIVSGTAPFDKMPDPYQDMNNLYVQAFKAASLPEMVLRPLVANADKQVVKDPDTYWTGVMERAGSGDKALLSQSEVKAQILHYMVEATRNGSQGRVREAKILVDSWGFELSQIQPTVHLWYWADDKIVPQHHGRYLEQQIPNTEPHFMEGGGHFGIFMEWRAILEALLG
jgi:pimeloyl-ACP methyl ester carboxylesterase